MLDLSKRKKSLFTLKLPDGTVLIIPSPKKRIFEKMAGINEMTDTLTPANIDEVYGLMAEILSSNTQNKKYSAKSVGEMLDFDDINAVLNDYMAFAGYVLDDPN